MEGDARQVLPCILCGGAGIALTVLANHRHRFLVAEQLEEIGAPLSLRQVCWNSVSGR